MLRSSRFLYGVSLAVAAAATMAPPGAVVHAQGCVVARGAGITPVHAPPGLDSESAAGRMQTSVAYRYLHSDRHYVGSEEQKERKREGSQVINDSHFVDISIDYAFNDRTSLTLAVPYAKHDRSSVVRDSNRNILRRFHTQNSGFADLRLTSNTWLMDPKMHADGNILLGLGVDIPTGNDDAEDYFDTYNATTGQIEKVRRTVDQSVQLGDGGWGVLVDVFAYRRLTPALTVFFNGFYAATPEQTNGVPTFRGNPFEAEMSIADTYMARAGFDYLVWPLHNMTITLDARVEGVPVHDLVGGSDGFRRPGYSMAIEPGVSATVGSYELSLSAPISAYRNRERSVADRRWTEATGVFRHGDAAFADFLVLLNVAKAF